MISWSTSFKPRTDHSVHLTSTFHRIQTSLPPPVLCCTFPCRRGPDMELKCTRSSSVPVFRGNASKRRRETNHMETVCVATTRTAQSSEVAPPGQVHVSGPEVGGQRRQWVPFRTKGPCGHVSFLI